MNSLFFESSHSFPPKEYLDLNKNTNNPIKEIVLLPEY